MSYIIAPSILAADMTCLGEEVSAVMAAGADMVHFDVMDNHYVPNLTIGPFICQHLAKKFPKLIIDVHLMAKPVDDLIVQFAKAGAGRISIHPEASLHLDRSLQLIRQQGCEVGLVLNPSTSIENLRWTHHHLDFVLVMTVNPGLGGQRLLPEVLDKIALIHQDYPQLAICVDGGVGKDNLARLATLGATQFVIGSAIFSTKDYGETIAEMRKILAASVK